MATLYDYCNSGDNNNSAFYGANWRGQTFTASADYEIESVNLKLYRVGSPGDLIVSILTTDGDDAPTGYDIDGVTGTTNGNTLTTDINRGEWREITLSNSIALTSGVKYAIVLRAPDGDTSNKGGLRRGDDTYDGGHYEGYGGDGDGGTWGDGWANIDMMFETWGSPPVPGAKPSVLSLTTALNAPAILLSPTISPSTLSLSLVLKSPDIKTGIIVSPSVLSLSSTLKTSVVKTAVIISPSVLSLSAVLKSPAVSGNVRATPSVVSLTTTLKSPVISISIPSNMHVTYRGIAPSADNTLKLGDTNYKWKTIYANQFKSGIVTGTAPLVVVSTTLNTNLNADLWDGKQFADYLDQAVKQASSPTFVGLTLSGAIATPTDITASGLITGGSLTDGTLTIDNGSITDGVDATFSGLGTFGTGRFDNIGVGTAIDVRFGINIDHQSTATTLIKGISLGAAATSNSGAFGIVNSVIGVDFTAIAQPAVPTRDVTITGATGGQGIVQAITSAGVNYDIIITNAYAYTGLIRGYETDHDGTGVANIGTGTAFYAKAAMIDAGAITTLYSFYDEGQTVAGTNWGYYGLSAQNYLSGKLLFGQTDGTIYVWSSADGWYNLVADIGVEVNAPVLNVATLYSAGDVAIGGDTYWEDAGSGLPFGCIEGIDETVVCTVQNTWYKVTFDTIGQSNLATVSTVNNEITVSKAGVYIINVTACFHSAQSSDFELLVQKNDTPEVEVGNHLFQTTAVADKVENTAGSCQFALDASDIIHLWVRCTSAAGRSAIFDHVNLHCTQVGG